MDIVSEVAKANGSQRDREKFEAHCFKNLSSMTEMFVSHNVKYAQYAQYTTSQLLQLVHCIHGWAQVVDMHQTLELRTTMRLYSRLIGA